jgi:hypothetical protein
MMSHCRACYFRLPPKMRRALYSTHDDYVGPYNESLEFLGHESPSAREDRIEAAAIREGTQIAMREPSGARRLAPASPKGERGGVHQTHLRRSSPGTVQSSNQEP